MLGDFVTEDQGGQAFQHGKISLSSQETRITGRKDTHSPPCSSFPRTINYDYWKLGGSFGGKVKERNLPEAVAAEIFHRRASKGIFGGKGSERQPGITFGGNKINMGRDHEEGFQDDKEAPSVCFKQTDSWLPQEWRVIDKILFYFFMGESRTMMTL